MDCTEPATQGCGGRDEGLYRCWHRGLASIPPLACVWTPPGQEGTSCECPERGAPHRGPARLCCPSERASIMAPRCRGHSQQDWGPAGAKPECSPETPTAGTGAAEPPETAGQRGTRGRDMGQERGVARVRADSASAQFTGQAEMTVQGPLRPQNHTGGGGQGDSRPRRAGLMLRTP